ncbi:hypothetical protein [Micropruina sp.]|uniref:hypothetical protein n=1 Tax=Micropruina sp. TaxID=2737536 RepID=UPI0039E4234A
MAIRWDFWRSQPGQRSVDAATSGHLDDFVATRRGVEAYLEPQTTMTRTSLLLVAFDGEWTRRSIESPAWGRKFASRHALPIYDAAVVGYPQRMRDYNARHKGGN